MLGSMARGESWPARAGDASACGSGSDAQDDHSTADALD